MSSKTTTESVQAVITLLSSVSHIGTVNSIQAVFHRESVIDGSGRVVEVPTITGNAMRGMLRRAGMLALVEELDLPPLPLELFYALFSGGALTQKDAARADVILQALPILRLFGTAFGNRIYAGRIKIGKALPIVREVERYIPAGLSPQHSAFDIMQTEYYVRKDDGKDPHYKKHIASVDDVATFERAGADTPQQMRYAVETMMAGTRLYWWYRFDRATELEHGAFYHALAYWARAPFVGGKSSVGHGHVALEELSGASMTTDSLTPLASNYVAYLHDNRDAIKAALYG